MPILAPPPPAANDIVPRSRLQLEMAAWTAEMIESYRAIHDLPAHSLAAEGYPSIGCRHCTDRVAPGEDSRAGRWRGRGKVECGMHPRAAAPE